MELKKLSVIIPVFNEVGTIEELVRRVGAVDIPKEVVIVDDGSTDGTREILSQLSLEGRNALHIHLHDRNRGKGAAVRTGIERAVGDVLLIQDADLEYDPCEYPNLLRPILDDLADVVYGSRFLGGPHRVLLFWHYAGNKFLTLLCNALTNLNLSDMETCYKVFRREVFDQIRIQSDRFEFEPEITIKVAKKGFRIYETPISYHGRSYADGKKITWVDGLRTLFALFRYKLWN